MKEIRPAVAEANKIAKIMKKDISFQELFIANVEDGGLTGQESQDEVLVKVQNFETGAINNWSVEKFMDKLDMMKDALSLYESNKDQSVSVDQDAFDVQQEPMLLGTGYYVLQGLAYLMDSEAEIPIVGLNSEVVGQVTLNVVPCDEAGDEEIDEDNAPDDPQDLLS